MRNLKLAFLSSTLTLALSAGAASAQTFDWSGGYMGLNAGSAINADTRIDQTTGSLPNNSNALSQNLRPSEVTISDDGFAGGAQVGYNTQLGDFSGGRWVVGMEADFADTNVDETLVLSNTTNIGPLGAPSTDPVTRVNEYKTSLDYLGTVRARVGVGFDRVLVYGTGGLAYGQVNREITFYGPNANTTPFFQGANSGARAGYVYGAGIEYAVPPESPFNMFASRAVTVKAEFLHYDLGDDTLVYPGVNGGATIGSYTSRVSTDGDVARVGMNFKF